MALKKKIPQPSGVEPEYFRLDKLFVNPGERLIEATFAGYLSAAARTAGKNPVEGADVAVRFANEAYDELAEDNEYPTKSAIYAKVKTTAGPFEGATNN